VSPHALVWYSGLHRALSQWNCKSKCFIHQMWEREGKKRGMSVSKVMPILPRDSSIHWAKSFNFLARYFIFSWDRQLLFGAWEKKKGEGGERPQDWHQFNWWRFPPTMDLACTPFHQSFVPSSNWNKGGERKKGKKKAMSGRVHLGQVGGANCSEVGYFGH